MKNKFLISTIIITFIFLPLFFVSGAPGNIQIQQLTMTDLWLSIRNIATWFFSFLVLAGIFGVVIGGYFLVSSGGDTGKVTSGRNWIIYSLIGILIGSFAIGLVRFFAGINFQI